MTAANSMRAEKTKAKQTAMNQSIAVAYETLGREWRALILSVVMVRTVVMPWMVCGRIKTKEHMSLYQRGS